MGYTLNLDGDIDWDRPVRVTCLLCHARHDLTAADVLQAGAQTTCKRGAATVTYPVGAARIRCTGCGLFLLGPTWTRRSGRSSASRRAWQSSRFGRPTSLPGSAQEASPAMTGRGLRAGRHGQPADDRPGLYRGLARAAAPGGQRLRLDGRGGGVAYSRADFTCARGRGEGLVKKAGSENPPLGHRGRMPRAGRTPARHHRRAIGFRAARRPRRLGPGARV